MVDVKAGDDVADIEVAEMLRRSPRPVLLVANKADNQRREDDANEFYELGLGEPLPTSATNGAGVGEVLDMIEQRLPWCREAEERSRHAGGDHRPAERRKSCW